MNKKITCKILYIEDDEDDFMYFKSLLDDSKRGNFIVDWVSCEEELDSKNLNEYDIFFVDFRLPTTDGISLMKNIKKKYTIDKPFIILTGTGNSDIDEKCLSCGAYDYLVKGKIDQQILERSILYCYEKWKVIKNIQLKNIILEMVINSIYSFVFVLNDSGEILKTNQQVIGLVGQDPVGKFFDDLIEFYPHSNKVFDLELKNKFEISKQMNNFISFPKIDQGIIRLKDGNAISCIVGMNLIEKFGNTYKMISITDNTADFEEKKILIKQNEKMESRLKRYGIEKGNPNPIIDLIDSEFDKIVELEKYNDNY